MGTTLGQCGQTNDCKCFEYVSSVLYDYTKTFNNSNEIIMLYRKV